MNLKEAVEIYQSCPKKDAQLCENCVLNTKRRLEDVSVCSLLSRAEARAERDERRCQT
jgi:hypothetical protein